MNFRIAADLADDIAAMMRRILTITTLVAVLVLTGCQTPGQYMKQHGQPDLISDETREFYRMYRPGDSVEKWRNAITVLYYLDEQMQVRFKQGQVKKSAIPEDEFESLHATKTLLESAGGSDPLNW